MVDLATSPHQSETVTLFIRDPRHTTVKERVDRERVASDSKLKYDVANFCRKSKKRRQSVLLDTVNHLIS